jgi:hypothetical protein
MRFAKAIKKMSYWKHLVCYPAPGAIRTGLPPRMGLAPFPIIQAKPSNFLLYYHT